MYQKIAAIERRQVLEKVAGALGLKGPAAGALIDVFLGWDLNGDGKVDRSELRFDHPICFSVTGHKM